MHDHGRHGDILASSGEDGGSPPTALDLIVHAASPYPRALYTEVLWARASAIVTFVCLFGFMSSSSFQAHLLICHLLPGGVLDWGHVILLASYCCPISQEVQHVALPH